MRSPASRTGDLDRALDVAQDCNRMDRDSGVEVVPATTASLLAALGRTVEATRAVEDALDRLYRIDEAVRPHHDLAAALIELGGPREAAEHARAAYRQAWGDGPPYCEHWDLARASRLLNRLDLRRRASRRSTCRPGRRRSKPRSACSSPARGSDRADGDRDS